jgi:hypothetical protein
MNEKPKLVAAGSAYQLVWNRDRDFMNRRRNGGTTQRGLSPDAEKEFT